MSIYAPQVAAVVGAAWERFGRLDIVVNNAGRQFSSPALDISPKGWHAVVETNLYGTSFTMHTATRRRVAEATPGSIINIGTIIGRGSAGIVRIVRIAAARAGAINASQYLAVEWAPHRIHFDSIAVGVVASEGLKHYPAYARASFGHYPMRHLGDIWDVAQGVAWLASPASAFITGTTLKNKPAANMPGANIGPPANPTGSVCPTTPCPTTPCPTTPCPRAQLVAANSPTASRSLDLKVAP